MSLDPMKSIFFQVWAVAVFSPIHSMALTATLGSSVISFNGKLITVM
jgi:hypothetical protein